MQPQQPPPAPKSQIPYHEAPQQSKQPSSPYKTQTQYNDVQQPYDQPNNASVWGPPTAHNQQGTFFHSFDASEEL